MLCQLRQSIIGGYRTKNVYPGNPTEPMQQVLQYVQVLDRSWLRPVHTRALPGYALVCSCLCRALVNREMPRFPM